jgi:trigger factor
MEEYLDNEEQTVDEFDADLEKRVRDAVAAQFVLDQVAKTEEIEINEGELQEHLFRRAQQSGQNPQQFIQHMVEHNHIPEMVSEVVRGKALALIVEAAKVVDEAGNHVELKNLRPDGTIGDPEAEAAAAAPQFADFAGGEDADAEGGSTEGAAEPADEADKA